MSDREHPKSLEEDIARRRAQLSPEQRVVLERRLAGAGGTDGRAATIPRRGEHQPACLSFAQEQQWILNRLHPGNPAYHVPRAYRLIGPLNIMALVRSLSELVSRHETLRTSFHVQDGEPVPVVADAAGLPLPLQDLSIFPEAEREARARRMIADEVRQPFDLGRGPLVRAQLIGLAPQDHVLALTMHHIISDDWSARIFLNELLGLYDAFSEGMPSPLPALPIQYMDYAAWQRQTVTEDACAPHLAYFRDQLEGAPHVVALPYDRPRPAMQTFRGAHERFAIEPSLEKALVHLGQRNSATLFMVLMAAFNALLHRYTRQHTLVVGFPVAGRNVLETEGLIGILVNTLALRTDVDESPRFQALLARVRERVLNAQAHQDLPFARLVEAIQPQRNAGHSPIYQVMFILEDARVRTAAYHHLSVREFEVDPGVAPLDLMLEVQRTNNGLACAFTYNVDLFEAATVARMCGHFRTLLQGMVADPDARVGDLPLLTPDERRQLLVEWNDTRLDVAEDLCLHQLVEAQAGRTPEAVALACGAERLTYRELNDRADALARQLRACDVGPEILVGIFLRRSPSMVVGILATLKAGGAYVPLDPAYPAARVTQMLDDAQVSVVLTQSALVDALPATSALVVRIDEKPTWDGKESRVGAPSAVTADNLAYVIYTSGSTGTPKGVAIAHRNACALMQWARSVFCDEELKGVLCSTSINFDLFVFELFVPLSWGGAVILAENVLALPALPARDEITLINTVPSAMAELVRDATLPASVRTVNLAGEPLRPQLVDRLYDLGVDRVYDLYGPTETTTYSTFTLRERHGPMTVGRPIANTRIYLLDEYRQPTPIGVRGEVFIGGVGVARGYLNRPELTDEKFVPDPFSGVAGERLYATGDLARYMPDGGIQLLGRLDHQVKVRGFRIELGEIESELARNPGVREAAVVTWERAQDDTQIVAYVVWTGPDTANEHALRDALKTQLPEHMVPATFVTLDALPRTPNGKIDRKNLPDPTGMRDNRSQRHVPPRTEREATLAGIWEDLLHVSHVGVHDNFFELGGHSLLGARVMASMHRVFQKELPLQALFETPTVAGLAASLDELSDSASDMRDLPPLERVSRRHPLPLSFAQERLWFVDRMEPGQPAYNISSIYRIRGPLDIAALERALHEVVRCHESLRTCFPSADGLPMQIISEDVPITIPIDDLRNVPSEEREREAQRLAVQVARTPFDLATGPVIRLRALHLDEDEHFLVVVMHHIISDGWSRGIFMRELFDGYHAIGARQPRPPRDYPIQYADFAVWQRQCFERPAMERQRAYWKERLAAPLPVLDLPSDRPRPRALTFHGATKDLRMPRSLTNALKELSRREDVTLFMVLLAAFQALLHRYTGLDDIIVGVPIGNRPRTELDHVIGLFVNTLALRSDFSENVSFRKLLKRVKGMVLGAFANQEMPFEKLVEELHVRRDPSRAPLTQVMFAFQNYPDPPLEVPGLRIAFQPLRTDTAKVDLTLFLHDRETGLEGSIEYNTDLFDANTIERLCRHFTTLLQGAVADLDCVVSQLPLLPEDERRQLLTAWNGAVADFPQNTPIHTIFEARAMVTPDAFAVVSGAERLTYAELNTRANQLAHRLHELGVTPRQLVCICLERSIATVVGLLGIVKAGAAYVPLSIDYPRERLAAMLADTAARIIVTHSTCASRLPIDGQQVVCLDADAASIARQPDANPTCGVNGGDLAYVAYTSGSTGIPQGVCVPHQSVTRLVINTDYVQLSPQDVVAQASDVAFDAATFEVWGALLNGAKLVILAKETLLAPRALASAIDTHGITVLFLTTALFNQIAQVAPATFSMLKHVLFGGEAATPRWVREVLRHEPPGRLLHVYGPTECTTFATCFAVDDVADDAHNVPIGRPIANSESYVLDEYLQPVPVGVSGELCLGGPGLARGYLNNAALTHAKFVKHPFDPTPGARIYRTGDIVRFLPDGNIEFLGRKDFQIKISGFRVELGEIETMLAHHVSVRDVVVLCREDTPGSKRLVAYVVRNPNSASTGDELRAFLRSKLPEYMVPSAYVMLDSLPLTPHGKIARDMLPAPEIGETPVRHLEPDIPQNACEAALKEIWEDVLGVRSLGMNDNFFDIGGNSLMAVQLFARIEKVMSTSVPVGTLFLAPTIAQLAEALSTATVTGPQPALLLMRPGGSNPPVFWVHSVTGRVELYYRLVHLLDGDRPMYGLQALDPPRTAIEAMAAAYVNEMRTVQPLGPYHLVGHCFGGVVAYEIARQLCAAGETVALLALLESVVPNRGPYRARQLFGLGLRMLKNIPGGVLDAWRDPNRAKRRARRGSKKVLRHMLPQSRRADIDIDDVFDTGQFWDGHRDIVRIHGRALMAYVPKPFPGRITLFKARTPALAQLDHFMGWSNLAQGGVDVRDIPGTHDDLLEEPHLNELAQHLRGLLSSIDARV